MKTMMIIGLAALLCGCASTPDLTGTWKLVETRGAPEPYDPPPVKILNDTHFAFGRPAEQGIFAGGGTWWLEDGSYLETIHWHTLGVLVGETIRFDYEVKDGRWYHTATFTAKGERFHIEEVWEKVESE